MFSIQWWFDVVLVPVVITIFAGGLVAFYASVMAIRLTFFYDIQRQAASAVADKAQDVMNETADQLARWYQETLLRYSRALRAQNQFQAAEDLGNIAYRIWHQFDFLEKCPPDPDMVIEIPARKILTAGMYNNDHQAAWAAEILALGPDWSEVTRIWRWHILPRKRLRRILQKMTWTGKDVKSIRWTATPLD